ncbi:MAG: dual specificity protein phosphatase family protein [Candidatus Tectimicrobiota bacterium]
MSVPYDMGFGKSRLGPPRPAASFWHLCLQRLGWIHWPFLLLRRSFWGLVLGLNWWDIVDEQVLVGGAPMFDDLARLRRQGVGALVNLRLEQSHKPRRLQAAAMEYLWLPVVDAQPPSVAQILHGLTWIETHIEQERTVYIHCAAGMGRSVTLLACWYLYTQGMSVPQVLAFIKKRRPQTALTRRQCQRIEEIAALLASNAGRIPALPTLGYDHNTGV